MGLSAKSMPHSSTRPSLFPINSRWREIKYALFKNNLIFFSEILEYIFYVVHQVPPTFILRIDTLNRKLLENQCEKV
jgi:hypothetical protein